jgi:hypothetical protein
MNNHKLTSVLFVREVSRTRSYRYRYEYRAKKEKAELRSVIKRIPHGRVASADEIANVVEFSASDKASYVTGASYFVDGGMTLYPSFGVSSEHEAAERHNSSSQIKRKTK